MSRPSLTRAHRVLLGLVAGGACLISGIGFAGSYAAVRELALEKGFGTFSYAFPIGVDAGIVVLLALDLVLTWLRIPFPLLRQTAWLLTAATIAFNAAASWGDSLGMAMHAVIPVLFVVVVEASRHAVGRIAAITADRHMESVRLMRWVLSPVPTFRLWRRMKLWELRSYDETVRLEQNRLVYRAQLRFRYGRGWRRSAPFQALLPLKLAKYGVPLDPSVLDRIDGPLHAVQGPQAGRSTLTTASLQEPVAIRAESAEPQEAQAGQAEQDQAAASAVSAAMAVPTLAKLAAVRLRDAQDPQGDEQPARPAAEQSELNVWTARAVRAHTEQMEEAARTARTPGQASPWFKPPRPTRSAGDPVEVPVRQEQRQRADRPVAAERRGPEGWVSEQRRPAPQREAEGRRAPVGAGGPVAAGPEQVAEAEPIRIGHRPVRLDGELHAEPQAAVAEQLPFDRAAAAEPDEQWAGRRPAPEPLDPDVCFEALISYMDVYDSQPDQQRFAEFLTREWNVAGSRPDGSVNPKDLDRIWQHLQDRYVAAGRE
ncbi:DUF2637 domain-containing protein [Kitasatospora sp. NPDC048540]|uniref:DUF2637 domain-containing protein n=1 Tax=unclassified Kitasatospora TaxID=2633591 RepID=UPI0018F29C1F|nr:DUF2637 domain-containing protein [Kitasatospora sp. MBT63]